MQEFGLVACPHWFVLWASILSIGLYLETIKKSLESGVKHHPYDGALRLIQAISVKIFRQR
jgi:hypothetical protein